MCNQKPIADERILFKLAGDSACRAFGSAPTVSGCGQLLVPTWIHSLYTILSSLPTGITILVAQTRNAVCSERHKSETTRLQTSWNGQPVRISAF